MNAKTKALNAIHQALREGCWFVFADVGTQRIRIADARIQCEKLFCKSWKSEKWYAVNEWDWEKIGIWDWEKIGIRNEV